VQDRAADYSSGSMGYAASLDALYDTPR